MSPEPSDFFPPKQCFWAAKGKEVVRFRKLVKVGVLDVLQKTYRGSLLNVLIAI